MKSNRYTVMFIPDGESSARSRHISKRAFFLIIAIVISILLINIGSIIYFFPKISEYHIIKNQHKIFSAERTKILNLTRDLERIKQMDELVRASLGTTLDIDPGPENTGSIVPTKQSITKVSYIENIPSVAPISGFISQKSENLGLFIKTAHNGIDIVAKRVPQFLPQLQG